MARSVAINLVVTGNQQASAIIRSFSRDITAIQAQASAFTKAISGFQTRSFGSGPTYANGVMLKAGLGIESQSLSTLGNTLKIVTNTSMRLGNSQKVLSQQTTEYTGNVESIVRAQTRYAKALEASVARIATTRAAVDTLRASYQALISVQNQAASAATQRIGVQQDRITAADAARALAAGNLTAAKTRLANLEHNLREIDTTPAKAAKLQKYRPGIMADIATAEADYKLAVKEAAKVRRSATRQINKAQAEVAVAEGEAARLVKEESLKRRAIWAPTRAQNAEAIARGERAVDRAVRARPGIPTNIQAIATESPATLKMLQGYGLGAGAAYGTSQFTKNIIKQGAMEGITVERDLERQVTRVSGAWKDQAGILQRVTATYDQHGRVIETYGRNLKGIGNILNQLGHNFVKVIEFAIATTVVFGAFRYAIQEISTITNIDKGIRQLSITAQLTRPQAVALFQDIADIAIATATPLQDLVKATDDIALATKRAGQSSAEWKKEILSLTQSVGILTNLAGIDTVAATDQLVATMKQLGVTADDLPGILSKITAVAGGQSNAIADVTKGLGVLAEAGLQAGLTIDEMIATVQTLSQVTSKSPSEVATALKQLIGALDGPGGSKALAQYNIALRDGAGNLRNIIDIYSEISDKINKGVIPQDEVKGLVRAIAGGPRRAPDASALLSSIGDIAQVTERSVNASNEALIANAKILDTASAKFIQLQATLDKFATTKFAETLSAAAESLVGILTKLLDLFTAIPTGIYTGLINLVLLTGAVKFATTIGNSFITTLLGIRAGLQGVTAGLGVATGAQLKFGQAQQLTLGLGGGSRFGGVKGAIGGAALAGAAFGGIAAATGASPLQAIGSGAMSAGLSLLLNPIPIPHMKLLGGALTAAGFALSFFTGEAKKSEDTTKALNEEVHTLTENLHAAQLEANNYVTAQKEQGAIIDRLQQNTKRTVEEELQLTSATEAYVIATLNLAQANKEVSSTFDDLLSKIPGLEDDYRDLINVGKLTPNAPEIKELQQALTKSILEGTGQVFTDLSSLTPLTGPYRPIVSGTSTMGAYRGTGPFDYGKSISFDLSRLVSEPKFLRDLFGTNVFNEPTLEELGFSESRKREIGLGNYGKALDIPKNSLTAVYLQTALKQLIDSGTLGEVEQGVLVEAVEKFSIAVSSFDEATTHFIQLGAVIQSQAALGILSIDEQKNEQDKLALGQLLAEAGKTIGPPTRGPSQTVEGVLLPNRINEAIQKISAQELTGKPLSIAELVNDYTLLLQATKTTNEETGKVSNAYKDLEAKGKKAVLLGIYEWIKRTVGESKELDAWANQMGLSFELASEKAELIAEALENAKQAAISSYADRALQLLIAKNSGDYEGNEKGYQQLVAQNEQAKTSNLALLESFKQISDVGLVELVNSLSQVVGLQGLYIGETDEARTSTEALTQRVSDTTAKLIESAVAAGVNAEGIKKITEQALLLAAAVSYIPTYKLITIEIQTLETRVSSQQGDTRAALLDEKRLAQLYRQKAALEAAQKVEQAKEVQSIIDAIMEEFWKGTGNQFGQLPKAGKAPEGPDISSIDIPEEIAKSTNQNALIQEAIRRAKALQAKFPSEYREEAKNDIVELLKGTQRVLEVRGVKDDLLRKALEELAEIEKKRLEFETKADTISRIRVGAGTFAGLVNVPFNKQTGVSVGGPQGPITVNLNLTGQVLTPAQFAQLADQIGAAIKSQIAG